MPHISTLDWTLHTHIGLDLDETLAATSGHMIDLVHNIGKMEIIQSIEDIKGFDWYNMPGADMTREEAEDFWRGHSLVGCLPMPGAIDGVYRLSELDKHISIITARNEHDHKTDTLRWCAEYFPEIHPSHIHFANHLAKNRLPKSTFCKNERVTLMIDDGTHNIDDLLDVGISCILLERPWNREYEKESPLLYRVKDWREIIASLEN